MTSGQAVRTRSEPVAAEELDSMVNGSSRIKIEEMPECKVSGGGDNEIWLIITQGCLAHEAAKDSAGVESESLASLNVLAGVADDQSWLERSGTYWLMRSSFASFWPVTSNWSKWGRSLSRSSWTRAELRHWRAVVLERSKATRGGFDLLDFAVKAFAQGVGQTADEVVE